MSHPALKSLYVALSLLAGAASAADPVRYLARHGIRVDVSTSDAGVDGGHALLSFAQKKSSDLIVMGAYGHSRFREILLGGMTRGMLADSTVALWMAH